MPIANHKPTAPVDVVPNLPRAEDKRAQTIVSDDYVTPLRSLMAFMEGAPWTVDYFSQVVAKDNDLREVDPGQPGVYQQYQKINRFELRVTTPLASSYDTEQGITTVTGTGLIYPVITPNVNDYFITSADTDKVTLFRITSLERKTFNKQAAFAADYVLVGYLNTSPELFADITTKVIREYYFDKDRMIDNLTPMVRTEVFEAITDLRKRYKHLVAYYFRTFYDRKSQTLVLPGQSYLIYDPYLTNYTLKIVETFDAPEIRRIKQIPTDNEPYINQPTFWDALLAADYTMLGYVNTKMGMVSKLMFDNNTWLPGIRYSPIDYVVYPETPDTTMLSQDYLQSKLLSSNEIIQTTASNNGVGQVLVNTYKTATAVYTIFHNVLDAGTYVMTPAFYNETSGMSVIEILTKDYMKGSAVDLTMLKVVLDGFERLSRLEQFYFGPIILTLILGAERSQY